MQMDDVYYRKHIGNVKQTRRTVQEHTSDTPEDLRLEGKGRERGEDEQVTSIRSIRKVRRTRQE